MTCEVPAYEWQQVMPGAKLPHGFDFETLITRWREPGRTYATGAKVRVLGVLGVEFEATTGGQAGDKPIHWSTTIDLTVPDGSITWTVRAVSTDSLLTTLTDAIWTADSGITVSGEAEYGQVATATLQVDADADGDLGVTIVGIMADGSEMPVRVILPVATPVRACER